MFIFSRLFIIDWNLVYKEGEFEVLIIVLILFLDIDNVRFMYYFRKIKRVIKFNF